jgi:predicted RNA-binding protein with TRAM domain
MFRGGNRPSGNFDGPSFAPVKVGEEIDVRIEAVGEKGDGIAKKKGFILFVPGVKEGEEVKIRVTKVLRKVGFAEVIGKGSPKQEQESQKEPEPAVEDSEDFGEESESTEESSEENTEESSDDEDLEEEK